MKVYIAIGYPLTSYAYPEVEKVFLNEEQAQAYAAEQRRLYPNWCTIIEPHEVEPDNTPA